MAHKKNAQLCTGAGEPNNSWMIDRKSKTYDCYRVLEKSAWIWRIVGIFPFTIKGPIGMRKYKIQKFYAVQGFLMCSACIGDCVYGTIRYNNWLSDRAEVSVTSATIVIRTIASLMCMSVATIWRIFRHEEDYTKGLQISGIVDTMVRQDLILEKMNCFLHYESNAKILCVYVWTMSATVLLLMAYDFYASSLVYESVWIQWLFWIIPLVAQVLDLTIFVSLVGLLGLKFRALNKKIKTVVMRANSFSPKFIVNSDICAENLQRIAKVHYSICAVGKRINSFFNTAVIINVITAFIILSTTLYYIFVEVEKEGKTNYIRIGTYVHWEFIHSVPIIIIVAICNWTFHQSIDTGKLIHEIRVGKIDSRLYESVKTFSLQLHHQKLEFNAGGLFPLNSTLIQTMVGNITTYLVILIQFQPKLDMDNI